MPIQRFPERRDLHFFLVTPHFPPSLLPPPPQQRSWRCGVDDPIVGPHLASIEAAVRPQEYETPELVERTRRLANQAYPDSATFVPIRDAESAGWTRPIRVTVDWSVIDGGDRTGSLAPRRMCTFVGETIEAKDSSGSWRVWTTTNPSFAATDPCNAKTVLAGSVGQARYDAIKSRTNSAMDFWRSAVKVKPVSDSIVLDNSVATEFNLAQGTSYAATDLVIIMTARPSPSSPIAGFAVCYQRDQRGRCTVGQFNWVPEIIDVENTNVPDTMESELHTALHEMVHVLGGMSPGSTVGNSIFLDDTGAKRTTGVFKVEDDPVYPGTGKKRTLIVSPKVANLTKAYFNCPEAEGMALEDVPLGKGSHWEARLMGPELMSYGSGSGQVYISDLTLAFLEDTNQYVVDYTKAGPIVTTSNVDDFASANQLAFLTKNEAPADYVPPPAPPAGVVRWGGQAGCGFLNGRPTESWPSKYVCKTNRAYGCTPDNRMSAVCIIKGDYSAAESTCGEYRQDGTGANCVSLGSGVPSAMRWFATDGDASTAAGVPGATAATTGGYNNAMDYVPVNVGYWNCMYATPKTNTSTTLGGGDTGAGLREFVTSFGKAADMETFGGQSRCPGCRCLTSSLMELTKGYNPAQPEYGLCYRVNCYRPDYLQVAIRSAIDARNTFWYPCPVDGGKLYIPGFTGRLACPAAKDFCALETVTGIRYPEQNAVIEAIFWGGLCALVMALLILCSMPCLRDRCINCSKACCGARIFEVAEVKGPDGGPPPLPACPARLLGVISGIALVGGLALTGACGYAIYIGSAAMLMPLLAMGILTSLLAGVGLRGSCKRAEHGPSCYLLVFFFADVLLMTLMLWTVVYSFAFTDWTSVVEKRYDTLASYLPAEFRNGTRSENIVLLQGMLQSNVYAIAGVFIALLLALLATLCAAGRMIHGRTLLAVFMTFGNNLMLAFGTLMLIVGLYFVAFKSSVIAGAVQVVGIVLAAGAVFIVIAAIGHAGVFKRSPKLVHVYQVLQFLLGALAAAGAAVCFRGVSFTRLSPSFFLLLLQSAQACAHGPGLDVLSRAPPPPPLPHPPFSFPPPHLPPAQTIDVSSYINSMDDKALGAIASSLGFALTSDDIVVKIQSNLNQLGLAFVMVLLLQIALFVTTFLFLWALKAAHLTGVGPGNVAGGGGRAGPMILTDNHHHGGKAPRAKAGAKSRV
jgi:hypothetical protein